MSGYCAASAGSMIGDSSILHDANVPSGKGSHRTAAVPAAAGLFSSGAAANRAARAVGSAASVRYAAGTINRGPWGTNEVSLTSLHTPSGEVEPEGPEEERALAEPPEPPRASNNATAARADTAGSTVRKRGRGAGFLLDMECNILGSLPEVYSITALGHQ